MNITIEDNWDTEIIIPIENGECILLVSNASYSKIKKKIANVNSEKSRRRLMVLYSEYIKCSSKENKICLPYSIAKGFENNDLAIISFRYENEKAYFLFNRGSDIENRIWR